MARDMIELQRVLAEPLAGVRMLGSSLEAGMSAEGRTIVAALPWSSALLMFAILSIHACRALNGLPGRASRCMWCIALEPNS